MKNRKITVYVKSTKTKESVNVGVPVDGATSRARVALVYVGDVGKCVTIDRYTLPPNQREVIDLVKKMAEKYDYAVEIVDIAKENILERLIEEIKGLDIIPTVKTSLGGRLEGFQITKENVELLLLNETRQRQIA